MITMESIIVEVLNKQKPKRVKAIRGTAAITVLNRKSCQTRELRKLALLPFSVFE